MHAPRKEEEEEEIEERKGKRDSLHMSFFLNNLGILSLLSLP